MAAVVAGVTALFGLVPLAFDRTFYFVGDQVELFGPLWILLADFVGTHGGVPLLDPLGWAGGNFAAEAADRDLEPGQLARDGSWRPASTTWRSQAQS